MRASLLIAATLMLGIGLALPSSGMAQATMEKPVDQATLVAQGIKFYSDNCGRCHNIRTSAERTDQEWRLIISHMRARANLPRTQSEAILAFLQATNGDEPVFATNPPGPGEEAAVATSEPATATGSSP